MNKILSTLFLSSCLTPIYACTTIIVGKDASAGGKTIIARTSDTIDARRAKNLKIYQDAATTLKTYIGLPYWDLESNDKYDMAQVATNQYGVALSATETIQSNAQALSLDAPSTNMNGVAEPNIPSIVMPFAQSASDAVDILGKAIEEKGVESKSGFGVLIADKQEAWYLETLSGHQWVAIKIPADVYFVAANGPGQIQAYTPDLYTYKMSHFNGKTPITFASENGIDKNTDAGNFNFRETYGDVYNVSNPKINFIRIAYLQNHFNPDTQILNDSVINSAHFPMFLKPKNKISVAEVQQMLASHYEDYPQYDPYLRANKDESQRTFYYPISNLRTSNGHVTVVGNPLTSEDKGIANLEYIAIGMPEVSFYLPIYYGVSHTPQQLTGAIDKADINDEKLFWQFRKLQALVFLSDPEKNIDFDANTRSHFVQEHYQTLSAEIESDRLAMEQNYLKNPDSNLIDNFMANTIDKVSKLNRQLIQHFMDSLDVNSKYALTDDKTRMDWFTAKVREQDCNYRADRCKGKALFYSRTLSDGPVL